MYLTKNIKMRVRVKTAARQVRDWGTDIPVETMSDRKGRREIKIKRYLMGDEKTTKIIVRACVLTYR